MPVMLLLLVSLVSIAGGVIPILLEKLSLL